MYWWILSFQFQSRDLQKANNMNSVLLFGPTDAKVELFNIMEADQRFAKIKIEVKHADKMTKNQQHAFVKKFLSKSVLAP